MKKFTKIIICLLLCVFSLSFVACGDKRTDHEKGFGMPAAADPISGNDGLAVRKGSYLYYVNGYKTVNSTEHTQDGVYSHGALMVAKLDSNGNVVTNENGLINDDYSITLSNRLCGFEATNLYLAGDYLYFATPSKENKGGKDAGTNPEWAKDYVEFYRIKLDKSAEAEKIYQADVTYENLKFEYYEANNDVYIVTYEKGESLNEESSNYDALIRVCVSTKEASLIANNVKSYTLGSCVCYTTQTDGYKLFNYNVAAGSSSLLLSDANEIKIETISNNRVYVVVTELGTKILKSSLVTSQDFRYELLSADNYDKIIVDNEVVMAVKDNVINFVEDDLFISSRYNIKDADAKKINIIGVANGSIVYYADGANENEKIIKTVSHTNLLKNGETEIKTVAAVSGLETSYLDLDDGYLYFYKKVGSHSYLHRLDITTDGEKEQMIGAYLEADIPAEEEIEE